MDAVIELIQMRCSEDAEDNLGRAMARIEAVARAGAQVQKRFRDD
jgi:hypothetical protein